MMDALLVIHYCSLLHNMCAVFLVILMMVVQLSGLYRDPTLEDQIDYAIVRIIMETAGVSV